MANIFESTYDEQWMNQKKGLDLKKVILQNAIL